MILFDTLLIFLWKHYKCIRSTWLWTLLSISIPPAMSFMFMYLMNAIEVDMNSALPEHDLTARYESIGKVCVGAFLFIAYQYWENRCKVNLSTSHLEIDAQLY